MTVSEKMREAIEKAREFLLNISYSLGTMSIEYLTEKDGEKMREAIKVLENGRWIWIFVDERLPNEHECVKNDGLFVVSDGNKSYFDWFDFHNTKKFLEPTIAGFCIDNAVIAWMPLPDPYKEESEVEK